jgi:FAD-linked oxidoreductase
MGRLCLVTRRDGRPGSGEPVGWRNWAGTQTAHPARTETPDSTDALVRVVRDAARAGLRVKAVGAGHSFTGVAVTDGVLVRPDRLTGIVAADPVGGRVTVLAGTPLHRLNVELAGHGLAMTNLGDIDRQTVAGAVSTGTHGTGATFTGLAGQVRALEIVLADGELVACSPEQEPDLFAAARLGLGAIGLIATVTLECVPAFVLAAHERPQPLDDVLADLDALVEGSDHAEFYWFPHTRRTLTKVNTRMPPGTPPAPVPALRGWIDDELLSNTVFGALNELGARVPALVPAINGVAARGLSARRFSDVSYRVFASPRRVVFREMEYALPRAALPDVLARIDAWVRGSGEKVSFPVEVRFAAADDVWLSTAYGRDTAYVAVHMYHRTPYERYFRAVEAIARDVGGRPHWGKIHYQDADSLRPLYPRFDDVLAVRRRTDPGGMFSNPYLDRVLGPAARPPAGAGGPR